MNGTICVRLRYYNVIRDAAGKSEETLTVVAGTTLLGLLRDSVAQKYPAVGDILFLQTGELSPYTRFFRNSVVVEERSVDDPLEDGDEIRVFPAVAGG